jgi:predicted MPP superfamily phosphohydrolase
MKRKGKIISFSGVILLISIAVLLVYSLHIEPKSLVVEKKVFKFYRLPKNFDGYKIALISDLHYDGESSAELVKEAVKSVNRFEPDIILLAGDYVTFSKESIEPCMEILKELKAKTGIFAVLGNHDHSVGAMEVSDALRGIGASILMNSHKRINREKEHIYIVGVDDIYWGVGNIKKALVGMKYKNDFKILLSHIPDAAYEAETLMLDLVLSGHTHGGQIKFPFYKSFIKGRFIFSDLIEGEYTIGNTMLYVTRGLGTIGLPARFMSKPEVTEITLKRAGK